METTAVDASEIAALDRSTSFDQEINQLHSLKCLLQLESRTLFLRFQDKKFEDAFATPNPDRSHRGRLYPRRPCHLRSGQTFHP